VGALAEGQQAFNRSVRDVAQISAWAAYLADISLEKPANSPRKSVEQAVCMLMLQRTLSITVLPDELNISAQFGSQLVG